MTYIFCLRLPLEIWFDRLVLLVELGQVGNKIFDDVCVRKRVDSHLLRGGGRNAAYDTGPVSI